MSDLRESIDPAIPEKKVYTLRAVDNTTENEADRVEAPNTTASRSASEGVTGTEIESSSHPTAGPPKMVAALSEASSVEFDEKPTISAEHEALQWEYYGCFRDNKKTHTRLIEFLQTPDLPLCWQIQVHCDVGTMRVYSDSPHAPDIVRETCLRKAERLLEEARRVYVHDPKDATLLRRLGLRIEEGLNGPDID